MNCCRTALVAVIAACMLSLTSGCNNNKTEPKSSSANMAAMNDMCVCGHPVGSAPVTETYNSKTIAFCCKDCKAKFDAMTKAQKDEYVAKMSGAKVSMGAVNDKCPISHKAVNKQAPTAMYNGKAVGFCCSGCASQWDAMTDAKKAELLAAMNTAK